MDGFKKIVKMKTGGLVKTPVTGDKKAATPSKAAVKPAFKGSDVAKEKSKLSGHKDSYIKSKEFGKAPDAPSAAVKGRKAKAEGTVKKFKCGGGVYGAKKTDSDIKNIDAAKECKPKNISGVKKFQVGGSVLQDLMQAKELNRLKNAKRLGPAQQAEFAAQEQQQTPAMTGLGQQTATPAPAQMPNVDQMGSATGVPAQKRGGKVKKGC